MFIRYVQITNFEFEANSKQIVTLVKYIQIEYQKFAMQEMCPQIGMHRNNCVLEMIKNAVL